MAHVYAGILGLLAFLTVLMRGLIQGGEPDSVLIGAWCCLLAFSAIGYVLGRIAVRVVADSVEGTISLELAAKQAEEPQA